MSNHFIKATAILAALCLLGMSFPALAQVELTVRDGNVTGTLVDSAGDPVEGAELTLMDADGEELDTFTTNQDGEFEMEVEEGSYSLVVEDSAPFEFEVQPDSETSVLRLIVPEGAEQTSPGWWDSLSTTSQVAVVAGGAVVTGGAIYVISEADDDDDQEVHP